jgi:hypothetical protein
LNIGEICHLLNVESEDKKEAETREIKVIVEELMREGMVREEKGMYLL